MDFISYDIFNLPKHNNKDNVYNYGNETIIKETNEIKTVEYVNINAVNYPLDCYINEKGYCYARIYLLELISSNLRILYVGSTKQSLKTRYNQHIGNLKKHRHHNKELQRYYDEFMNDGSFEDIKINTIKKINEYENILENEHNTLIEITTKYNNKFDTKNKKIKVIYSE